MLSDIKRQKRIIAEEPENLGIIIRNTKARRSGLFYNKGNEFVEFRNNSHKKVFVVVLYTLC